MSTNLHQSTISQGLERLTHGMSEPGTRFVGQVVNGFYDAGLVCQPDEWLPGIKPDSQIGRRLFSTYYDKDKAVLEKCIAATPEATLGEAALHLTGLSEEAAAEGSPELRDLWQMAASLCSDDSIDPKLQEFNPPFWTGLYACDNAEPLFCGAIQAHVTPRKGFGVPITSYAIGDTPLFIQKGVAFDDETALNTQPVVTRLNTKRIVAPPGSIFELAIKDHLSFNPTGMNAADLIGAKFLRLSRFAFPPDVRNDLFRRLDSDTAALSMEDIKRLVTGTQT